MLNLFLGQLVSNLSLLVRDLVLMNHSVCSIVFKYKLSQYNSGRFEM